MTYTNKQKSILSLINKLNKKVFSPEDLYEAQGSNQLFSKKAIRIHLSTLTRDHGDVLTRVKTGQYMLAETASTTPSPQVFTIIPKEALPGFLAHEDIDKLIEWKNDSIKTTNEAISNLKLKITKLENQKKQLNNIKTKFC